jgi:glutamate racemase
MQINNKSTSPIGVFDSGLGGLTVLKALQKTLPNESFIYFGDTAHVPYGTKSDETVQMYSKKIAEFLLKQDVKLIVIACNTASAVALNSLKKMFEIPIIGVVEPAIESALLATKSNVIGIIGTRTTINSKAYPNRIKELNTAIETVGESCPLFVPLIEEGWAETETAKHIAETYLSKILKTNMDTLVLGCTHYPIMKNIIQSVVSSNVTLISSDETVSESVKTYLIQNNLENTTFRPFEKYYVTDVPQQFEILGSRFLGKKLTNIEHITIL